MNDDIKSSVWDAFWIDAQIRVHTADQSEGCHRPARKDFLVEAATINPEIVRAQESPT